jgi:hypothetical protein
MGIGVDHKKFGEKIDLLVCVCVINAPQVLHFYIHLYGDGW